MQGGLTTKGLVQVAEAQQLFPHLVDRKSERVG
jgi:hypothetical protein